MDVAAVKEIMETDVGKCLRLDGISNWVLRECNDQLADTNNSIFVMSLRDSIVEESQYYTDL